MCRNPLLNHKDFTWFNHSVGISQERFIKYLLPATPNNTARVKGRHCVARLDHCPSLLIQKKDQYLLEVVKSYKIIGFGWDNCNPTQIKSVFR